MNNEYEYEYEYEGFYFWKRYNFKLQSLQKSNAAQTIKNVFIAIERVG